MRKIKKINGFLVVKFNDREKREYEGTALGEYGVIDAEVYTGNLDIDRGAMEYDDADTLEVAVELARGLESEEDITDEPPTYTAAVETNESYTEETVEPTALIEGWTRRLATQVKSKHYPDTDPRTAAHELYGFKMALHQIGFLPESEVITDPDTFGAGRLDGPMPRNPEELLAFVCDERCKNRAGHTQEELDAICAKCPLGQLYEDAEAQDLRIRERSERALREHIEGVRHAEDTLTALLGGHEALAYNKCEWFRNAVNSVINFFKETLTAVGSVAKSVFEGIGNVIGSVMDAAKATVSEKLSNIKAAYEEHGSGISGVAAAAMEAVKGWYTAGYTFIDNLTGGKLSEIREKFSTAMSNIVQGISQKFTDARTAFSNGLNNIKNAVSGAVTWFFESGKRIVSTFANGIKSAFSSAVEAVKGGLQKIRNLLPFSDAKEGPLSTLTLSGQRTMTTYAHGLTLAGDAPAEAMNKSLQQVQGALDRKPEKKVDLGGGKKDKDESSDEGGSGKGKQVIIHKLLVPVDLKKIKDLQQLLALLQEVEDYAAANEDGEPGDDEDAVPAPA